MPTQKIVTLYQYEELPTDEAKEKVREWFGKVQGEDFGSYIEYDDFITICEMMGVDIGTRTETDYKGRTFQRSQIFWSGFWSQGDGASFAGTYAAKPGAGERIRAYASTDTAIHAIGDAFDAIVARFPELRADIQQGRFNSHYSHSMTMTADVETGTDAEGDAVEADEGTERELLTLFRRLADWLYAYLEADYNGQQERESLEENIRANEYTFTEDGRRED